jgi:hypothetical protein
MLTYYSPLAQSGSERSSDKRKVISSNLIGATILLFLFLIAGCTKGPDIKNFDNVDGRPCVYVDQYYDSQSGVYCKVDLK